MAYECIDRHVDNGKGEKVALNYKDYRRNEFYTFNELQKFSNQAANVLKDKADVKKGDRVFIFMPRTPELYFAFLGILKIGAIVGPLFETFMKKAVVDRLENSESKVLITNKALLSRISTDKLPKLETIVVDKYVDFNKEMKDANEAFNIEWLEPDDGFILPVQQTSLKVYYMFSRRCYYISFLVNMF